MQKSSITFQGVEYPIRTLDVRAIPTFESDGYASVDVAGESLWEDVGTAIEAGDYDACKIDNLFFYYVPDELLRRDATDKEIVDYLKTCLP